MLRGNSVWHRFGIRQLTLDLKVLPRLLAGLCHAAPPHSASQPGGNALGCVTRSIKIRGVIDTPPAAIRHL